uniref:KH-like RNA-binding domain-containing protein n=1 Tax=Equus asinus TaxID=9793 RepID=A0A9L0K2J6_EQUAS
AEGRGPAATEKGPGHWPPGVRGAGRRVGLPLGRCARAVDAAAAARARGEGRTPAEALAGLLRRTPPTPRARPRPWWFPARELSCPSACYLEARLAGCVFGPDRAAVPETEWRSQVLLTVRAVEPGGAVEVSVFGQPHGQNRGEGRPAEPRGLALGTARPRGEDGAAGGVLEGPGAAAAASRASCRLSAAGSLVGTGLLLPDPFGEAGVRDLSSLLACVSSGSGSIILMRTSRGKMDTCECRGKTCEDTARRQPSASQGERRQEKLNLLMP